jgi:hypothetical protein
MGVANRLLNAIFQLVRKRRLSFLLTVQDWRWLDSRIRWQVDGLVTCRDMKWMSDQSLEKGAFISQSWKDSNGVFTGYSYAENSRQYLIHLWGRPFWGCYNTYQEFDIMEAMAPVRLKIGSKIIERTDLENARNTRLIISELSRICQGLRETGVKSIPAAELYQIFNEAAINLDPKVAGKILKSFGLKRHRSRGGDFYDIE